MLEIEPFTLGPVQTNAYLVADSNTKEAAVIDPAWDGLTILETARKRGWRIGHLWYTHAHFDHIGGAAEIADALNPLPLTALHPNDHVLWRAGGGGAAFGFDIDPGPEPTIDFEHKMTMKLGSVEFEIRFTPGHTLGHCILYVPSASTCFCGDLIFAGSVGRTDLPGGDWHSLERSIREQIFTLPDDTRLLPGHGPETTVAQEKRSNPFVNTLKI
ncbi:MAG: MBL fold metallo-hydrolase [Anaerolineales bacterium]|nr:MBL fold metallo-hydrolase [Anaerolineales bacterium]MCL4260160.1 MBL fold metallo-hydrolase [Anaerolineales bacterium]GJQ52398.1 MAG: MBL fold metallo-hydrolase [Anaerolineaceae bacterium]